MRPFRLMMMSLLLLACCAQSALAQPARKDKAADSLPYQKYPTLPSFEILMTDSVKVFNTYHIPNGMPTLFMYFSPDCSHCVEQTQAMLSRIEELGDIRIYMITPLSLPAIKDFEQKMGLGRYPNITIGKEFRHFFPAFYGISYVPHFAVYDRRKNLVGAFEGNISMNQLIDRLLKL